MSEIEQSVLESMTYAELIELNKRIQAICRERNEHANKINLSKFNKGDFAIFDTREDGEILGRVVRINKKTLTVYIPTEDEEYLISPNACVRFATKEDFDHFSKL